MALVTFVLVLMAAIFAGTLVWGGSDDGEGGVVVVPSNPDPIDSATTGTASATVGGRVWEFSMEDNAGSICDPDQSGRFLVTMFARSEAGVDSVLVISAPVAGGDAVVSVGDPTIANERWIADVGVYDILANIAGVPAGGVWATATVTGNEISGNGMFYEARALEEARAVTAQYDAGIVSGTFKATCG